MPICLNCGRPIEPGNKFCDGCKGYGRDVEVRDLVNLAQASQYKPALRHDRRWLIIGILVLCVMLVFGSFILIASIPSGSGGRADYQASLCRKNMEKLAAAVKMYYTDEQAYPAPGTVGASSQLVEKVYAAPDLRCPSTGRHYILENREGKLVVVCDSGLNESFNEVNVLAVEDAGDPDPSLDFIVVSGATRWSGARGKIKRYAKRVIRAGFAGKPFARFSTGGTVFDEQPNTQASEQLYPLLEEGGLVPLAPPLKVGIEGYQAYGRAKGSLPEAEVARAEDFGRLVAAKLSGKHAR